MSKTMKPKKTRRKYRFNWADILCKLQIVRSRLANEAGDKEITKRHLDEAIEAMKERMYS